MKHIPRTYIEWVAVGVGALALFLFYFYVLPYHLFHREQIQLFLPVADTLWTYAGQMGALAMLAGDYLTQFFYYEGAGPAIVTMALLLWGWIVFRLLLPYMGRWVWIPALVAVLWEASRLCGLSYPLSGTLALAGIGGVLLLCRCAWRRWKKIAVVPCVALLTAGIYLFGTGHWDGKWFDKPNLQLEEMLAIDSEMYFSRTERLRKLLNKSDAKKSFASYHYNLLHAKEGTLPDSLMAYYQPMGYGLFLPMTSTSSYFAIFAANEVWFELGDMTMAEHAAILGMIFSPQHTGTRALRRLAEINLINGDEAAAMKYLRLLQKTACHRKWAEQRIPGKQTPAVKQWLERKRTQLPLTDIVRLKDDVTNSLRNLLRDHPKNVMARDYLLCFDLLNKDIESFANDYKAYGSEFISSRLYAEAMLIYLAGSGATQEETERWKMSPQVLEEFMEYNRLYAENNGNGVPLQAKFGKTYWFYYHYATKKEDL